MNLLLVLPILIPFSTAILSIFAWNNIRLQRFFMLLGMVALLAVGIILVLKIKQDGIQATQVGNWQAPVGITLVADLLSAIMVTMTGIVGLAVAIYLTMRLAFI